MQKAKKIAFSDAPNLLKDEIVRAMGEKKAHDILVMDLRKIKNAMADFFVICSGNSDTQVEAIASSVEEEVMKNLKQKPLSVEGKQVREWVLLDYWDVVVHVFKNDRRSFYRLEELWGDAQMSYVNNE